MEIVIYGWDVLYLTQQHRSSYYSSNHPHHLVPSYLIFRLVVRHSVPTSDLHHALLSRAQQRPDDSLWVLLTPLVAVHDREQYDRVNVDTYTQYVFHELALAELQLRCLKFPREGTTYEYLEQKLPLM